MIGAVPSGTRHLERHVKLFDGGKEGRTLRMGWDHSKAFVFIVFAFHRLRARLGRRPESTSRRRLFERSEFLSYLIRGGGPGTPLGPRTGEHGFGHFCRNKSDSSRGVETLLQKNNQKVSKHKEPHTMKCEAH